MSLKDLAGLSGIPGLDHAVTALFNLYDAIQNIKVYQNQCRQLHSRCIELLIVIRHNDESLFGTNFQDAVDKAELTFQRITKKLNSWSALGKPMSLLRQGEIRQGLLDLNQDVTHCAVRLNLTAHMESLHRAGDIRQNMDRQHAEIEEKIRQLLAITQDIQHVLTQPVSQIKDQMLSIQQAIHESEDTATPETIQSLQERLFNIHRESELLPPMTDLTGEVRFNNDHPVSASGGHSDVFIGEWLGKEKVALKLTRGINQIPKAQKRFMNEVGIWRQLQHDNVAKLYGIMTRGEYIYTVSPWMERGDALKYITKNPGADRLKILTEVATGLRFLHSHNVVHGDLRAANILISDVEVACITDFGLSVFIEEEVADDPSSNSTLDIGNSRWMAPELIRPELIGQTSVNRNMSTDVWSYGMLCLEIFTGQRPFPHRTNDPAVISGLISGDRPTRPSPKVTGRGLSDTVWGLMQECWHQEPHFRPPMDDIVRRMQGCQAARRSRTPSPRIPSSHLPDSPPLKGNNVQHTFPVASGSSSPIRIPSSQYNMSTTRPYDNQPVSKLMPSPPNTRQYNTISSKTEDLTKLEIPSITHQKSASMDEQRMQFSRSTSSRPSTAPALAVANAFQMPQIPELNKEDVGGPLEDILIYFSRDSSEVTHPVHLERPLTPGKPVLSTSLPTFSGIVIPKTSSNPTLSTSASEGSETNSELSPTSSISVDTISRKPGYIKYRETGSVKIGNLSGLVEHLILGSNDRKMHDQFRETFLTVYPAFTDAKTLFALLRERFEAVSLPPHTGQERVNVRYAVISVLELWLKSHHVEDKDVPLLRLMQAFIQSIPLSPTLQNSASRLVQAIDSAINRLASPVSPLTPSSLSSTRSVAKPSHMTPQALAVALTELEGKRFRKIIPSDYIGWLTGIKGSNGVVNFVTENDKLSIWVQKFILFRSGGQEDRADKMSTLLHVAQECRKLRNFSSACAIITGLASPYISGLKRTSLAALRGANGDAFLDLRKLVSKENNFRAYRKALKSPTAPCLPLLQAHLHDLMTFYEVHRKFLQQQNESDIINFDHYEKIYEIILHISSYQDPPPKFTTSSLHLQIETYMETQLQRLIVDETFHTNLREQAGKLAREELINFVRHEDELRATGFTR